MPAEVVNNSREERPYHNKEQHTHRCPGRLRTGTHDAQCPVRVALRLFACRRCWNRLPRDLQQPITSTHRRDHSAHSEAMTDACRWYRDHPLQVRRG